MLGDVSKDDIVSEDVLLFPLKATFKIRQRSKWPRSLDNDNVNDREYGTSMTR